MPIRVRWRSKEYIPYAFMLMGACGSFQLLFIFIAQYFLGIGNYLIVILMPIIAAVGLYFGSTIIFEAFAQVERRKKLKTQFNKSKGDLSMIQRFLQFQVVKPLLISFIPFTALFFISYFVSIAFFDNLISFLIAENFSTLVCLLIANLFEKNYAKVRRY